MDVIWTINVGKIIGCYNIGNVKGWQQTGGIAGASFDASGSKRVLIQDCYNIGTITTTYRYVGAITGGNGMNSTNRGGTVSNCYFLQGSTSLGVGTQYDYAKNETFVKTDSELKSTNMITLLGDAYTNDIKIKVINEETGVEEEVWKYNDGYPILKWQIEE